MKNYLNLSIDPKGLVGMASAMFLLPVAAIEKPGGGNAPKEKNDKAPVAEQAPKPANQNGRKVAMLGVGGMSTSETLSLHLGLEKGGGLTLYHITPGSAADQAGLKQHDIITEFDGKKIGNQNALRDAVHARKPGDEVVVKYISRGKTKEKKISLGERKQIPGVIRVPGINPEWLHKNLGGDIPQAGIVPMNAEIMKQLQDQMRKMQENQGGAMRLELGNLLKQAQKMDHAGGMLNFGVGTSITLMDNNGSITMKTTDGKKEVVVKDKTGKIVYEGAYQTEQDKAAVPEEIRERIDRLNLGEGRNGFKLRVMPPMKVPPADKQEAESAE